MWIVNKDLAMSCIPKNGSTSMRNAMPSNKIYENDEVLDVPVRVAWIREPIERLKSCYSFFHYLNAHDNNGQRTPTAEHTSSWEKFVDHALSTKNIHWNPQKEILMIDGEYIPTVSHKFEEIMERWGDYKPGLLPWQNACTKLPINDYRKDDINEFYTEDIALWHSL